jgi:hypothetical protein
MKQGLANAGDGIRSLIGEFNGRQDRMDGRKKDYPFPGERILARWIAEQVESALRLRVSREQILEIVARVLDDQEDRYGKRPVKS